MMESTASFELTNDNLDTVLDSLTNQARTFHLDFFKMNPDLDSRWNRGLEFSIYEVTLNDMDMFVVRFDDKVDGDLDVIGSRLGFFNTEDEAMESVGDDYNSVYRNLTQ